MLRVICRFRRSGMSWPLTPGDTVELWVDHRMVGEMDSELVIEVLAYHLRGAQLQQEFDLSLVPARKPLAPAIEGQRLERAKARRSRST